MEDLKNIIKEIKSYNEIKPDDNVILDCATRIFISNIIQKSRGLNVAIKEDLATDKQKNLLKRLNIKFPESITKKEAYLLIKEKKGGEVWK